MGLSWENITNRLSKMAMVMVVLPFAVGIFFAERWSLPLWGLFLTCGVSLCGVIVLEKAWRGVAVALALLSVGALLHTLAYRAEIPYKRPLTMVVKVETSSVEREGYTSAEAVIEECEDGSVEGCKVVAWGDSLIHFSAGDRLRLTTVIHPFRAERKEYAELMYHRGFVGSISLKHRASYDYIPAARASLHDWAVARLRSAVGEGDGRAVVLAMTTGERGEIRSELHQAYSLSGSSHLLAVSGLHIGIAFMLINFLLYPLGLLRYGNVVRSVEAVLLIWLYVCLCGTSPSAVRAAIMFSLLQLSFSTMRSYSSLNVLAGTAFMMLAFNTHLLFDISFQLSFVAVAGIVLWAMPLYRLCRTKYRIANLLTAILAVGMASTLVTMPLVASTFSIISVVGILLNPVVIFLANAIVLLGVVSLVVPSVARVAEWVAVVQNRVVEWAAEQPYGHFEITMSEGAMWAIYALFVVVTLLLLARPQKEKSYKIEE